MLYRAAWIALFGCGLLCYLILSNGTLELAEANQPDRLAEVASGQDTRPGTRGASTRSIPVLAADASSSAPVRLVSFTTDLDSAADEEPSWPAASTLIEQIKQLQQVPEVEGWSNETVDLLDSISQLDPNSQAFDQCLERLQWQVQAIPGIAAAIGKRADGSRATIQVYCEVSRLPYRLQRRIAIWSALRDSARTSESRQDGVFHSFGSGSTVRPVAFGRISFENLDPNWVEYLKLRDLQSAFGNLNPDELQQKEVARSVLARIYSPVLKPEQSAYIKQVIDPSIIDFLKEHATGKFKQAELLKRLEDYEQQPTALASYYLNDQYQNLRWSENPQDQALAAQLQMHYRNANLRLVVSERLMNRMIPELPTTAAPVNEHIKGARVSGQSQVSNRLQVELVPNNDQIELLLATTGDVQSDTIARTKSFRIQNLGKARFQVVQRVTIDPDGIDSSSDPQALSEAKQYVVGLESKMDNLPVVGWMARKLAAKKLREEAHDNNRIFKRTVESSAEKQMQEQVDQQVAKIRNASYAKLFQPLFNLDLEPTPMQMSTTEKQVVMRYRLAGQDQMAANTSRPRDSVESLMSFQMHQSALNNLIARIGLKGNKFTVDELSEHLREVAGLEPASEPASDQYAEIEFAPFDPIHIDFDEDRLAIKLNLKSLKIGETGKVWKYLRLTAKYRFEVDGMNIRLVQDDDETLIRGPRLRFSDRAAISTVMKVLFKQEYAMNSLPQNFRDKLDVSNLRVSQLVASDGWIAVSIDDQKNGVVQREEPSQNRTGTIRKLIQRR